jgi:hypothetical protein
MSLVTFVIQLVDKGYSPCSVESWLFYKLLLAFQNLLWLFSLSPIAHRELTGNNNNNNGNTTLQPWLYRCRSPHRSLLSLWTSSILNR